MTGKPAQEHKTGPVSHYQAEDASNTGISVRRLMLVLWYHKPILICTTLIALGCAFMYISLTRPLYKSAAEIKIKTDNVDVQKINVRALFSGGKVSSTAVQSEVAVLKSRSQIEKLARHMGLYRTSDLETFSMDDMPEISTGRTINQFKSLNLAPRGDTDDGAHLGQPSRNVIDLIEERLSVRNITGTVVINISYTSPNRALAAAIPQALAQLYIRQTLTSKLEASRRLRNWLDQRLSELRKRLRTAEEKVADFRQANDFIVDDKSNILLNRLSKVNSQIIEIQSELSRKRLQLKQARKTLRTNAEHMAVLAPFQDGTSSSLKKQERALLNQKAEAMTRYGPKHPEIKAINAELKTIRRETRKAVRSHVKQLENDVELLEKELDEQEQRFKDLRARFNDKKASAIKLQELKRNAESTQEIYDSFLKKYKRAIDTQALEQPEAELISDATIPDKPIFPKKGLVFALSIMAGITTGGILIALMMMLKSSYCSLRELERDGLDALGIIPLLRKRERRGREDEILKSATKTPIAEALRNIYMNIRLRSYDRDSPISVLAVTSTVSGEGKTSVAGWLAQTAACSGVSVCVVDGDMRKPRLNRFFGLDTDTALVDYLGGHAELDDIIQHSSSPGVDVITSRSASGALSTLLNGDRIKQLIDALKQRYDLVIIDTPALLAVPDARLITLHADYIAYLVAWNDTRGDMLDRGLNALRDMPDERISVILSRVDIRRQARHGYSDMLYYYGDV